MAPLVMKLYSTQLGYDISKAAMDVLSDRAAEAGGEANPMGMFVHAYMWSLGILIAGGTPNIQRNIIAERGLGMPRDTATNSPAARATNSPAARARTSPAA